MNRLEPNRESFTFSYKKAWSIWCLQFWDSDWTDPNTKKINRRSNWALEWMWPLVGDNCSNYSIRTWECKSWDETERTENTTINPWLATKSTHSWRHSIWFILNISTLHGLLFQSTVNRRSLINLKWLLKQEFLEIFKFFARFTNICSRPLLFATLFIFQILIVFIHFSSLIYCYFYTQTPKFIQIYNTLQPVYISTKDLNIDEKSSLFVDVFCSSCC
jgi:hypothetical protein